MKNNLKIYLSLLIVLTTCGSACGRGSNFRPIDELKAVPMSANEYRIQGGDTLMVNVWGEPKLSGEVLVREDGNVTIPLINDVLAEGKGTKQLVDEITARLTKFIPAASVSISIVQSSPVRYFLNGQFQKPGEFRSDKKISLLQAIATGGGFAPFANESYITIIRKSASGELRYSLDYNRIVEGREPNPELKNGDIIDVR